MDLLKGLPKGIFRGEERYGAQVDMCHFGLVGSGNPNPSNFRATHMAAATLRPALTPLVADLNGYCTSNAPCGRHPLPVRMYGLMYGGGQNMLRR